MNRVVATSLLGVLLMVAPRGTGAHAAPRRDINAGLMAASPPSGQELLQRMHAAVQRAGSFHFSAAVLITVPGVSRVSVHMNGDESTRQSAAHAVAVSQATNSAAGLSGVPAQRTEIVLLGHKTAERTGRQAWRCGTSTTLPSLLTSVSGSIQTQTAQSVGTVTVMGVPAWRVRAKTRMSVSGISVAGPATYDISQRDFTLLQSTTTGTLRTGAASLREQDSMTFSRYGERVQVQLPAACTR